MSLVGGIFDDLFGNPDYSSEYDDYGNQIDKIAKEGKPYVDAGLGELSNLKNEGSALYNHPNNILNELLGNYKPSAFTQNAINNTQHVMDSNAANSGTLGSSFANKQLSNAIMNQSLTGENNYLDKLLGMQQEGLGEQNNLASLGAGVLGNQQQLEKEAALGRLQGSMTGGNGLNNFLNDALMAGGIYSGFGGFGGASGGMSSMMGAFG